MDPESQYGWHKDIRIDIFTQLLNANDMLLRLRTLLSSVFWNLAAHNLHRHASAFDFQLETACTILHDLLQKIQTNLSLAASVKQFSKRHQDNVDRYDDRRGSKHQQLFFQEHGLC